MVILKELDIRDYFIVVKEVKTNGMDSDNGSA